MICCGDVRIPKPKPPKRNSSLMMTSSGHQRKLSTSNNGGGGRDPYDRIEANGNRCDNFTNILQAAFTRAYHKSTKKHKQLFALLWSACVKAAHKHVDPMWYFHYYFHATLPHTKVLCINKSDFVDENIFMHGSESVDQFSRKYVCLNEDQLECIIIISFLFFQNMFFKDFSRLRMKIGLLQCQMKQEKKDIIFHFQLIFL